MRIMAALAVSMMATTPLQAWADAGLAAAVEDLTPRVQAMCSKEYAARLASVDALAKRTNSLWVPGYVNGKLTLLEKTDLKVRQLELWLFPRPAELGQLSAWVLTIAETNSLWFVAMQMAADYPSSLPDDEKQVYLAELEATFNALTASVALAKCLQPSSEVAVIATEQGKTFLSRRRVEAIGGFDHVLQQVECTRFIETVERTIAVYKETSDLDQLGKRIHAGLEETFVIGCDKEKLQ
ncbi:hypothetical protein [Neogemmobacter tilapiae]|uniref:Imelysin-like domain-containing protein n=1 Tax=Neogemmobacter tilapiae TaxID=875041 RepID=A0A918WLM4_9RHOB|nr:hypothetical protein [Gemmobacter tilapiae]GHC58242.1 hypothetical protein GCM10007315_22300 [Gemmobacter tilapiae]